MTLKIAILIVVLSVSNVLAIPTYSQVAKVSLDMGNRSLEQVMDEIERQSEFYFIFNQKQIDVNRTVDIQAENKLITDILPELFKGTNVNYVVFDRKILLTTDPLENSLLTIASGTEQQQNRITGTVTDKNGPIPGVNVVVTGTTMGTMTDIAGKYSIEVPQGSKSLTFSFIGMESQEISIGSLTQINVTMAESAIGLDEVVVVGYGTQKKVNLTGSIDAVSSEKLENRFATHVADLIKGTSPNLNINMSQYGGEPGAAADWNIRGIGSISGDDSPLILVDGVEMDIQNIDPESIESFSVLKDASASAIYGSRAPFGVVLITTKTGKKDEKIRIQYNNNLSLSSPINVPHQVDALTWVTAYNQASKNAGLSPTYSDEQIERIKGYLNGTYLLEYNPNLPENVGASRRGGNANYDWVNIFYKDFVFSNKHNVNISGGNETTQYYLSGGFAGENGAYTYGYDLYKRYNFLANISSQVTNWLNFKSSVKYAGSLSDHPLGMTTVDRRYYWKEFSTWSPMTPMYRDDGTYINPFVYLLRDSGREKTKTNDLLLAFESEFEPVKAWKTNFSYSRNFIAERFEQTPKPVWVPPADYVSPLSNNGKPNAGVTLDFSENTYWLFNAVTSYEKQLGNHYFKTLIGYEVEENVFTNLNGTAVNLISEEVPSISTALGATTIDDSPYHWATQGIFGRLNYNFKEKYLVELSARYNGSSRFAPGNRWGFFPSASVGYNIAKENFWAGIKPYVNRLKIRGSYGSLGNQNVSYYLYLSRIPVYNELNWILNDERPVYATAPSFVSDDLTWETITTFNFGIDAGFLNNRLDLVFDWYNRKTTDMIGPSATLPFVFGASTPQINNAELVTKGFEIALSWKDRISSDFSYNVQFSLGDNKTTILKYTNAKGLIDTWYEGMEYGEIWGFVTDGIMQTETEVEEMPDQSKYWSKWRPGDIKYTDLNDDGFINDGARTLNNHGDLTKIGSILPRYNIGITAGVNWKGFDFNMFWQGIGKRDYYPNINQQQFFWGMLTGVNQSGIFKNSQHLDYWRPADETNVFGPNTDSYFAIPYFGNETLKNRQIQTRFLLNAAYLRLKNCQFGYTVPQKLSNKLFIQRARIFFSGENLLTLQRMPKILDPETAIASDPVYGGYRSVTYPISKFFSIGVNLTF